MARPETRYASSGDVSIAYQAVGEGTDVVFVPGWVSHVELGWHVQFHRELRQRLASFARLIVFDKRGTGLSDPVSGVPALETRMDDVRAVMDAADSSRAAIVGLEEGVPMSLLFAATYPERTAALVLIGGYSRTMWAPDYPWGWTQERYRRDHEADLSVFGARDEAVRAFTELYGEGPASLVDYYRQSGSPGMVKAISRMNAEIDVRAVLPTIRVPTLLLHGEHDYIPVDGARYMADRIPNARLVELPGVKHLPVGAEFEAFAVELERFLLEVDVRGGWSEPETESEPSLQPCSSPTLSARPRRPRSSVTGAGARSSNSITPACASSLPDSAERRSIRPETASSLASTALRAGSGAPRRSRNPSVSSTSTCGQGSIRASAS